MRNWRRFLTIFQILRFDANPTSSSNISSFSIPIKRWGRISRCHFDEIILTLTKNIDSLMVSNLFWITQERARTPRRFPAHTQRTEFSTKNINIFSERKACAAGPITLNSGTLPWAQSEYPKTAIDLYWLCARQSDPLIIAQLNR